MAAVQKFYIIVDHSGKAMDCNPAHATNDSLIHADRIRVHQWSFAKWDVFQQWMICTDGTIRSVVDGQGWDVCGAGIKDETAIVVHPVYAGINQQFEISNDGYIICRESGKCVGVHGGLQNNGTHIRMFHKTGGSNQKFRIIPVYSN